MRSSAGTVAPSCGVAAAHLADLRPSLDTSGHLRTRVSPLEALTGGKACGHSADRGQPRTRQLPVATLNAARLDYDRVTSHRPLE
ncbi:hypothetical protein RRG08_026615 [Elysia crispata]|uniref:Uncharacterized protein n=1 Tax=Elysia crispata TaxID=231223 RepID=A0AAE1AYC0_9GAST|nr:hypothetical protein RRG08_026615 [Elysia crispata]